MQELTIECSNELCNCTIAGPVDGSDVYCSGSCRNADEQSLESDSCSCGHPQCDTA